MGYEIFLYDDGYTLVLRPPRVDVEHVESGLSRSEVEKRLAPLRVDGRDEWDAFDAAEEIHRQGWTGVHHRVSDVRARAAPGRATPEDLDFIRHEIEDGSHGIRPTFLIATLHQGGAREEAVDRVVGRLRTDPRAEDTELALRFLAQWSPEQYEIEALPYILGSNGADLDERCWAMTYAGTLLRKRTSSALVEALARVAEDRKADDSAHFHAQRSLAEAAGWIEDDRALIRFERRDLDLPELVAKARERHGLSGKD